MATGYDKTATAQALGISKQALEAQARSGGYKTTEEYASSIGKNVGSSGSVGNANSNLIQNAISMNQQAIQPAVQSYQAQQPEIAKNYSQQRTTLSDKYDALLASIKGNQTSAENRQTVVTSNELGKRGISGDSTLAGQEITNAVNPITQQYSGLMSEAGLSKIGDINQSYNDETSAQRAVTNAIAQLQASAGQTGVSQGYTQQQNAQTRADTQQQNAVSMAYQQSRDKVADALNQAQLVIQQQKAGADIDSSNTIKTLQQQLLDIVSGNGGGGGSSNNTQPIEDAASSFNVPPQLTNNGLTSSLPLTTNFGNLNINGLFSNLGGVKTK